MFVVMSCAICIGAPSFAQLIWCSVLFFQKPRNLVLCKQFYTTKLDTNKLTPEQRMKAEQLASEIERENKMGNKHRRFGEVRTTAPDFLQCFDFEE